MSRLNPPPIKRLIGGITNVAKSITFTSIILGFLLALGYDFFIKFRGIWAKEGLLVAVGSADYYALVAVFGIVLCLGLVFFLIEREQNDKSEKQMEEMVSKLDGILNAINGLANEIRQAR